MGEGESRGQQRDMDFSCYDGESNAQNIGNDMETGLTQGVKELS